MLNYYEETFEDKDFSLELAVPAEYESCVFRNCNFSGIDLSGYKFIDTQFVICNLSNAKLTQTSFQNVTISGSKLLGLQFDGCSPFNFSLHFMDCQLDEAIFYKLLLSKTTFHNCKLRQVDFTEADLSGSIVDGCDLQGATFDRTDLRKTDLRRSYNYFIDPSNNLLKQAKFSMPEVLGLLDKCDLKIEGL